MCKIVLGASFSASVAFVIAALASTLTMEQGPAPWPIKALWISVALFGAMFVLTAVWCLWYQSHTPRWTFRLDFQQHPSFALIGSSNEPQITVTAEAGQDGLAVLDAHVTAKKAATVDKLRFSLTERRYPGYSLRRPLTFRVWEKVRPSQGVFITNLWDADWEDTHTPTPRGIVTPQPVASPYDYGYVMDFHKPKALIVGECLWIKVVAVVRVDWDGYLEFGAPEADGKWAYTRRRISLRKSRVHDATLPARPDSETDT